jgi:hypothetical protein
MGSGCRVRKLVQVRIVKCFLFDGLLLEMHVFFQRFSRAVVDEAGLRDGKNFRWIQFETVVFAR